MALIFTYVVDTIHSMNLPKIHAVCKMDIATILNFTFRCVTLKTASDTTSDQFDVLKISICNLHSICPFDGRFYHITSKIVCVTQQLNNL